MDEKAILETNQKGSRWSKALTLMLSFVTPICLFGLAWGMNGIAWNGEVTPLCYDMVGQYMPFMASLRYLISGEYSFLYNWNICLGGNFIPLFAYYLASPLNWITLFFELPEMANAIYLLTLIKIGLCGLSFSVYLIYGIGKKKSPWNSIVFATCYALMSYNIAYSMCIMWLDGVILLPIILLGIEKIIEGKRGFLYFFAIWLLFVSNFYISYMVGIFAALYIVGRVFAMCEKNNLKEQFATLLKFGINTVFALCCAMFLLLPTLKSYFAGVSNALENETLSPLAYAFGIPDLLKKILPQQYDSIDFGGLPSIYCGTVMVVLAVVFFAQTRNVREKIAAVLVLGIIISGFLIQKIDFIWHGFQYPHAYPYRYAFLFSATVLILAYAAWNNVKKSAKSASLIVAIASIYTLFELVMNASVLISGINKEVVYSVKNEFARNDAVMGALTEEIKKDSGFYRLGKAQYPFTVNDNFMYGIVGADSFTSTFNSEVSRLFKAFGDNHTDRFNSTESFGNLADDILGVKYKLSTSKLDTPYELVESKNWGEKTYYLYKNPDAFSIGFMAQSENADRELEFTDNTYDNQNAVVSLLNANSKPVYVVHEYEAESGNTHNDVKVSFSVQDTKQAFLYLDMACDYTSQNFNEVMYKPVSLYVDGELVRVDTVQSVFRSTSVPLKNDSAQHMIQIVGPEEVYFLDLKLYIAEVNNYRDFVDSMRSGQLQVSEFKGDSVAGSINCEADGLLCTTVPLDEGLTVIVDGQKVREDEYKSFGPFLAIQLAKGKHEIRIAFMPKGLKEGIIISILGLIAFVGYNLLINCSLFVQKKLVIR